MGQSETGLDGSYRIGGLLDVNVLVFWRKTDDPMVSQIGELGLFKLVKGSSEVLNEKVITSKPELDLRFIGADRNLTDSAVVLKPGGEYVIYLGGRNLDPESLALEFNSPFLKVARGSIEAEDLVDGITTVSFVLTIDQATPQGTYSLFGINPSGVRSALVGAININ